jgi:hypothetical protein
MSKSSSNPNLTAGNKEKARNWVREQASRFVETYSVSESNGPPHPAMNVLSRLTQAIHKLQEQVCMNEYSLVEQGKCDNTVLKNHLVVINFSS